VSLCGGEGGIAYWSYLIVVTSIFYSVFSVPTVLPTHSSLLPVLLGLHPNTAHYETPTGLSRANATLAVEDEASGQPSMTEPENG
jgi:hypothetical protein